MLQSLLKPCHIRLTARSWHKHGKQAWLRTPCHFQNAASRVCQQHCRARSQPVTTSCVVAQQPTTVVEDRPELTEQRMSWLGRSVNCGSLNESHIGKRVTVCGWVHRQRGLGGMVFCDIRDSTGLIQVEIKTDVAQFPHSMPWSQLMMYSMTLRWLVNRHCRPTPTWRRSEANMLSE